MLPVLEEDGVVAPEEWTALPAIKERSSFQLGPLSLKKDSTMDLMLLQVEQTHVMAAGDCNSHNQGGMLRWRRPHHTHLLVEVLISICLWTCIAFSYHRYLITKIADDKMMLKRSSAHQGRGQPATGGRAGQQGVASPGKLLILYAKISS